MVLGSFTQLQIGWHRAQRVLLLGILQVMSALSNQSEVQVCSATLYLLTYNPALFFCFPMYLERLLLLSALTCKALTEMPV